MDAEASEACLEPIIRWLRILPSKVMKRRVFFSTMRAILCVLLRSMWGRSLRVPRDTSQETRDFLHGGIGLRFQAR